jgi:myosin heavy subunit
MEKGFSDIERFFLEAEEKRLKAIEAKREKKVRKLPKREHLLNQIKNLNEKLKGKDRKIKELYREITQLRAQILSIRKEKLELEEKKGEFDRIEDYKKRIGDLEEEVAKLKGEVAEKEKLIEKLKSQEVPKPKVELFIEVALNSISNMVAGSKKFKVLFSKRFRKDVVKEVSVRPFLFDSFISALSRIDTTSKLLKRDGKHDIYRVRITSPYGEYRAIYLKLERDTVKFVRFGQRDSIYGELEACGWKFE